MLDLRALRLEPGVVRRERIELTPEPFVLGGQRYAVVPEMLPVEIELQPSTSGLYMKLSFHAAIEGPCMRCLEPAHAEIDVVAREYHEHSAAQHGHEELTSEYLSTEELDIERWVRDAIALALPEQVLCEPDCAGLCPHCGERLQADVPHDCGEPQTDTRWDALKDLL